MIVDASLLAFLAVPDERSAATRRRLATLLERLFSIEYLKAPALVAYELGNALHRKRRDQIPGTRERRASLLAELLRPVSLLAARPEALWETGRITESSGISFYDASYLALAVLEDEALLTADRGQSEHARALGIECVLVPDELERLALRVPMDETDDPSSG